MKTFWVHREIEVPAEDVWSLLTDPSRWPEWGPSVRGAELDDGRFERGATGEVTTIIGLRLPFEITELDPGTGWAWKVAGGRATAVDQ